MTALRFASLLSCAMAAAACGRDAGPPGHAPPIDTLSPTPVDATNGLRRLREQRRTLAAAFPDASDEDRVALRARATRVLEDALIDVVLPRWNGTPWSFDGTSTTPGTGSIACGYFVSTALLDAGLRVERVRLAQQASERIIETLVPPTAITRFSNVPIAAFIAAVARQGNGLYVVGLDNHVGFLVVRGGEVLFHHSSYVRPRRVLREPALTAVPLVDSKYRVVGKLFADATLIDAWLAGTAIRTKIEG